MRPKCLAQYLDRASNDPAAPSCKRNHQRWSLLNRATHSFRGVSRRQTCVSSFRSAVMLTELRAPSISTFARRPTASGHPIRSRGAELCTPGAMVRARCNATRLGEQMTCADTREHSLSGAWQPSHLRAHRTGGRGRSFRGEGGPNRLCLDPIANEYFSSAVHDCSF
jgi:hypothetical protein